MKPDISSIQNPLIKSFYSSYWSDRTIIRDFYELLPEDKYDFRLVDNEKTKSDSPSESLAHIIEIQEIYLSGIQSKKLVFNSEGIYENLNKQELLDKMDEIEKKFLNYLDSNEFDNDSKVQAPWGETTAMACLYAMKDHYVLHAGWNLALMDVLNVERFESLKNIWG